MVKLATQFAQPQSQRLITTHHLDKENQIARYYQTSEFPTLIIFKNKQEVKRYTPFDKSNVLLKEIIALIQK